MVLFKTLQFLIISIFLFMIGCNQALPSDILNFRTLSTRLGTGREEWYPQDEEERHTIQDVAKDDLEFLINKWKMEVLGNEKLENKKRGVQVLAKNDDFPRRSTTQQSPREFVANYSYPHNKRYQSLGDEEKSYHIK